MVSYQLSEEMDAIIPIMWEKVLVCNLFYCYLTLKWPLTLLVIISFKELEANEFSHYPRLDGITSKSNIEREKKISYW